MRDSFASLLASRAGKLALSLLVASPVTSAIQFTPVPSPNLNINSLGRVAFAGDFDSISLYKYVGQSEQSLGRNGGLLSRYPDGVFATLNQTDGDVKAMCALQVNGAERIVFAGNFTSVGDMRVPGGVALLDPVAGSIEAMEGLNGSVNALYCDRDAGQVYVGGLFEGSNSTNAIIWKDGWVDLTFAGFNGIVQSIVAAPNGNIVFAGEFNGLNGIATTNLENSTQVIPISNADISAQTSSGLPGFTDPQDITCKSDFSAQGSGETWLLADKSTGFWKAEFGFGFLPTSLKLWNTDYEGRGTKTWRYTALPDGGIMNFSYVDPSNGQKAYCDARCPLPEGNTTAQDFTFVNVVGMNAFKIDISDWYGDGAGLNGIQLFQEDMYAYAIDDFNEPKNCATGTTGSSSTNTGSWVTTPSHDSSSEYLTAVVQGSPVDTNAAIATFFPDIKQSGNYSVTLYTPGCRGDGTCGSRGRVNVTAIMAKDETTAESVVLFQTNDYDKYDEVYNGYVDATDGFRPQIVLQPAEGQGPTPLTIVAQRVRFSPLTATSGNVNGLFEHKPGQQLNEIDLSDSVINAAGASLDPQERAVVTSVAADDTNLYVGGNFSTDNGRNNIFLIRKDANEPTALPGNGLDRQVMTMFHNDSMLYVGGNFTNTADGDAEGLNGVAALVNNKWQPLGAGVNGVVMFLVPFSLNLTANSPEQVLAVSGFFTSVNAFGNHTATAVDNLAIWVPSRGNWLHNLGSGSLAMQGRLMTFADIPGGERWFGGSISSGSLSASGTAELRSQNDNLSLGAFPIDIETQQQQASLRKRAITATQDLTTTGVQTGTFYKENGMNKTILAGHFASTDSNGQNITNVLIIDGNDSDKISGFSDEVDANSTFAVVTVYDNILYAGGVVTGQIDDNLVAGIVAYDLSASKFADIQPPRLQGQNVTVNAIALRPKSKDVYVAGQFQSAGALSCAAVCVWNTERNQWTSPSNELSGDVTSLIWTSDTTLLIAGNMTSGENTTRILSFDSSSNKFAMFPGANDLPGPITALTVANSDGDELWASGQSSDGTVYLQRFDGSKWKPVDSALFGQGSDIRGLQAVTLSKSHGQSDLIDQDQDLLLMGQINITGFGTASGALFNGTALIPFLLATTSGNTEGSLSSVFVENPNSFFKKSKKHLGLWAVVLIGLAIALALTCLLIAAGFALELYRKKAKGYSPAPQFYPDRLGQVGRLPPEQLFGTLSGPRAPAI
ncbi:hypothetical protein P153DRAFT_165822 [Dothidotthia symphoricarpi CBS 119687]|uniref:Cellular morphogenesis protein n=1 Tax=Dothidotthia symphoricarpi CBS 119687 TaxID=1392245 RepID=A0A6A6ANM1_9PLEO|nr:uncharacterized protein P153DRAFT_165822 [Dothidotthia symphoricarpi CBS 119687]KAF2132497.1 hypothetical protein P153DRAFT_165822 [Dothidotthia symphoricarpi CBS 119687]